MEQPGRQIPHFYALFIAHVFSWCIAFWFIAFWFIAFWW
jgi:hypothetical protein